MKPNCFHISHRRGRKKGIDQLHFYFSSS
nr:unnamed protein product [Callosobruchus chinensis]